MGVRAVPNVQTYGASYEGLHRTLVNVVKISDNNHVFRVAADVG